MVLHIDCLFVFKFVQHTFPTNNHQDVSWQALQCTIVSFQAVRTVKGAVKRLAADLYSTLAWNFLGAVDKSQGVYDFQDAGIIKDSEFRTCTVHINV